MYLENTGSIVTAKNNVNDVIYLLWDNDVINSKDCVDVIDNGDGTCAISMEDGVYGNIQNNLLKVTEICAERRIIINGCISYYGDYKGVYEIKESKFKHYNYEEYIVKEALERNKRTANSNCQESLIEKTFLEKCLDGEADIAELDQYVEYYHTHDIGVSLRIYLGLTPDEYEMWGENEDTAIEEIIKCRREKLGCDHVKQLYMIIFKPTGTQFIVKQSTSEKALSSAILANQKLGKIEDVNMQIRSLYQVDNLDLNALDELFQKNRYIKRDDNVIVFDD